MKSLKTLLLAVIFLVCTFRAQGQEIFDAILKGDYLKIKELVENNPQLLKAKNARQSTPLHVAASLDNEEIAKYLIEKGSDIEAVNANFYTPLMYAGIKVTALLVNVGADVNYRSRNGWSALDEALWRGKSEVVEFLLDNGVKMPDIKTPDGKNKLFAALRIGCSKYLDKYLQTGLDPMVESETKSNLIHFAAESNSVELIDTLVALGVPSNRTNIYGWTPLHIAAYYGNKALVELLVQNGLDINARTIAGKSTYNLANEANATDILNYLDSLGADKSPQRFPVLTGNYLGQAKPDKKAEPFAPGILAAQANYHSSITFTPDGNALYGKSMMPTGIVPYIVEIS